MSGERPSKRQVGSALNEHGKVLGGLLKWHQGAHKRIERADRVVDVLTAKGLRGFLGRLRLLFLGR